MPVEFKDYYATLGVTPDAGDEDIKKAFRKLARQYHPDVAKDKKAAEEKFKEINEAYEVLGDPEKRKKYDQFGTNWKQGATGFEPPPGWQNGAGRTGNVEQYREFHFGGTGFSDFFEQLFGRRFSGGSGFDAGADTGIGSEAFQHARGAVRGNDIEAELLVTLDEVLHGSIRSISLQRWDPKSGQTETLNFKVRIPMGVRDGQTIRVSGKGGEGIDGGEAGDLFLHVRYAAHPDFRARGADLYCKLYVAPWEAVLGTTAEVPALDGSVSVRIPAATNNDQRLRVSGHGLPLGRNGGRGDLYATVNVQLPGQLSAEERQAWEKLRQVSRFNPRRKRYNE